MELPRDETSALPRARPRRVIRGKEFDAPYQRSELSDTEKLKLITFLHQNHRVLECRRPMEEQENVCVDGGGLQPLGVTLLSRMIQ